MCYNMDNKVTFPETMSLQDVARTRRVDALNQARKFYYIKGEIP